MDAAAASCAASRGLSPDGEIPRDPAHEVRTQIMLVLRNTWERLLRKVWQMRGIAGIASMFLTTRSTSKALGTVETVVVKMA